MNKSKSSPRILSPSPGELWARDTLDSSKIVLNSIINCDNVSTTSLTPMTAIKSRSKLTGDPVSAARQVLYARECPQILTATGPRRRGSHPSRVFQRRQFPRALARSLGHEFHGSNLYAT